APAVASLFRPLDALAAAAPHGDNNPRQTGRTSTAVVQPYTLKRQTKKHPFSLFSQAGKGAFCWWWSAVEVLADSVEEVQDVEGEVGAGGGETLAGLGEVVRKGVEPAGEVSPISRGGGFGEGQPHSRAGGSTRKGALEGKGCVHGF